MLRLTSNRFFCLFVSMCGISYIYQQHVLWVWPNCSNALHQVQNYGTNAFCQRMTTTASIPFRCKYITKTQFNQNTKFSKTNRRRSWKKINVPVHGIIKTFSIVHFCIKITMQRDQTQISDVGKVLQLQILLVFIHSYSMI